MAILDEDEDLFGDVPPAPVKAAKPQPARETAAGIGADLDLDTTGIALQDVKPAVEVEAAGAIPKGQVRAETFFGRDGDELLFFDIETIPDYRRLESFRLPPIPTHPPYKASNQCPAPEDMLDGTLDAVESGLSTHEPENIYLDVLEAAERRAKKPRKGVFDLITKIRRARAEIDGAEAKRTKLLSTTPEYCQIVALGWAPGLEGKPQALVAGSGNLDAERVILEMFWSLAERHRLLVGFNVCHFDLPTLLFRSMLLGVKPTRLIDLRGNGPDTLDLMVKRFGRMTDAMPCKDTARAWGLKIPCEGVDGSQVDGMVRNGQWELLRDYVISDVVVDRQMFIAGSGYFWF